MKCFQILNNEVLIENENYEYKDTPENFVLDGGSLEEFAVSKANGETAFVKPERVIYDNIQKHCVVNDEWYKYPNVTLDSYIDNIHDFIAAKEEREYVEPEPPTLEELKTSKIAGMKAERDIKEVKPIEYNGSNFDYDDKARDRINAAIIALEQLGEEASLAWTTADNTEVMVTAQDLKNVISAVAVRSNNLHIAYRDAKEAVEAVENEETLNSIKLEDYIPSLEVLTEQ
uniref:DUF4376 domain-containing protein n=1 Tax=Podoviridae sp. ctqve24 TaxID=2826580 RepID=A0A8S5MGU2_9CAUD|nr:MAG TPA: protein of unknown function (DUF4376) [Podoviridae sp. ctqve24]